MIKVQKNRSLQIYNMLALPIFLYVSETWTIKGEDKSKITNAAMKLRHFG